MESFAAKTQSKAGEKRVVCIRLLKEYGREESGGEEVGGYELVGGWAGGYELVRGWVGGCFSELAGVGLSLCVRARGVYGGWGGAASVPWLAGQGGQGSGRRVCMLGGVYGGGGGLHRYPG
jgi:hypothetical protein